MKAQLGIDGNCAFALLGRDLQSGEVEFVEILPNANSSVDEVKRGACKEALEKLKIRLDLPFLEFYFGPSHPDYEKAEDQYGKTRKFICRGCFNPCILETMGFPETCCFGKTGSRVMTGSNKWIEFKEGEKK